MCDGAAVSPDNAHHFAYLLGEYLGDGHLVTSARVPVLCISAGTDHRAVRHEVEAATEAVRESPCGHVMRANTARLVGSSHIGSTGRVCSHNTEFSNEPGDILAIMGSALDQVGVEWRFSRRNCISIARRDSVAVMDAHVGPKT